MSKRHASKRPLPSAANALPLVLAEKERTIATPGKVLELSCTGDFESVPLEILEVITSQLKGRDLGALACTCKYFRRTTLVDRVAQAQVDFVPRARGVEPNTERGETWPMLSYYFQCQSAAAAQSTALSLGRHHGTALLVPEDASDPEDPRGGEIGLYSWGRNFYGEVGDASFEPSVAPKRIKLGASAFSPTEALPAVVCCGASHSASLSRKGDMFVWGLSSCNQLGIGGNLMELNLPRPLTAFERRRIVSVASGANHTLAIDESGQLWTCGQGSRGQLGHGDNPPEAPFTLLTTLQGYKVVAVAAGVSHSVALTSDGSVFSWGDCSFGQLGHPAFQQVPGEFLNRPWKVQALNPNRLEATQRVTAIAAGGFHTLMLTVTGEVFVTGRNNYGQCGLGHRTDVWAPTRIPLEEVASMGPSSTASEQRTLDPISGMLLNSASSNPPLLPPSSAPRISSEERMDVDGASPSPSASAPSIVRAVQMAGGLMHTVVLLMRAGRLETHACGYNGSGALGTGDLESSSTLRSVRGLSTSRVTSVVCGDESSAAVGGNGEIFLWGRNGEGNLGLGDDRSRVQPTKMEGFRAVHPDRTLRRRGAKSYATFKRPGTSSAAAGLPPSSSSSPPSSSGWEEEGQPDAFWIVRALWNKSRHGRVPGSVEDALTTTQQNIQLDVGGGMLESERHAMVVLEDTSMSVGQGQDATVNQQAEVAGPMENEGMHTVQGKKAREARTSGRRYSLDLSR